MARRLVLHIGLMKSGTSFVQHVLQGNRRELRRRGVLFVGKKFRSQVVAVRDVIEHGGRRQPALEPDGPWNTMLAEIDAWPDVAVVSMEFLGPRPPSKIRQILASLPETDVTVVASVRDLARSIPAMWQENVQNWGTFGWDEYLEGVRREDRSVAGPGRAFWTRQDSAGIVGAWAEAAGPDHVTVVTVPPRGAPPSLLWDRFASILGVEAGGLDLDVLANPSLGLPSLMMLSRFNERLRQRDDELGGFSKADYERVVKQMLSKRVLARRSEPRLGYHAPWVSERADLEVSRLAALGVRVVGDLEELRAGDVAGTDPSEVTAEDQLDAALDALAHAASRIARR